MQKIVSILIPAFNSSNTLRAAIDSCLKQKFRDFELIIFNNASSDHSKELVKTIDDSRIVYLESETTYSIAEARNILLKAAKGEFIAWLDADDTMVPDRLEKQVNYMRKHPDIDILGSWIYTDSDDLPTKKLPLNHNEIKHCLWFKNCMIQPSVMSRNFYAIEKIFYDESYGNSVEDYELWYRLRNVKKFANISEFLCTYHMSTPTELNQKRSFNRFEANIERLWEIKWMDADIKASVDEKHAFVKFLYNNNTPKDRDIKGILNIIAELKEKNPGDFFLLLLSFHSLRLWRNMRFIDRLKHIGLLFNIIHYPELKKRHVI